MEWKQDRDGGLRAEFEKDGFTLVCRFVADDITDYSELGELSDTPKEGAIDLSDTPIDYKYFNPAYPEYGQEDLKRVIGLWCQEWYYGGIVVSAVKRLPNLKFKGGIGNPGGCEKIRGDITLAECALWGIESDSGEEYFTSTALELAEEAIEEAKRTLKDLCS